MSDLPGLAGTWITCVRPHAHHSDDDFEVMTQRNARHGYARWDSVRPGEPWKPRPHLDHRPLSARKPMSDFIADRLPTADDGDKDGDVWIQRRPDGRDNDTTMIHWSYVKEGTPWRHTSYWKPKRELPGINGQWIRASAVKPTAADADSDGEVQVQSGSPYGHCRAWDGVTSSDLWRPYVSCDKRPIEPAGHRLPGYWGELISGHDALPIREDGDWEGDVIVEVGSWRRWTSVGRSDRWRPWDTSDTRPRRSN